LGRGSEETRALHSEALRYDRDAVEAYAENGRGGEAFFHVARWRERRRRRTGG